MKSSILLFLALLSLSPVLRTLSASTSSDSIWALSACLFILNVLLADYRPARSSQLGQGRYVYRYLVPSGDSNPHIPKANIRALRKCRHVRLCIVGFSAE